MAKREEKNVEVHVSDESYMYAEMTIGKHMFGVDMTSGYTTSKIRPRAFRYTHDNPTSKTGPISLKDLTKFRDALTAILEVAEKRMWNASEYSTAQGFVRWRILDDGRILVRTDSDPEWRKSIYEQADRVVGLMEVDFVGRVHHEG